MKVTTFSSILAVILYFYAAPSISALTKCGDSTNHPEGCCVTCFCTGAYNLAGGPDQFTGPWTSNEMKAEGANCQAACVPVLKSIDSNYRYADETHKYHWCGDFSYQ